MDKELLVLSAVERSPEISQRELAHRTGLSLGTINILIKKMIREGLIKLESLPAERAVYILTPKGMDEKVSKTRVYLRNHYQAIEQMRQQLKVLVGSHFQAGQTVCLSIQQPELNELLRQVLHGSEIKHIDLNGAGDLKGMVLADHDNESNDSDCWINVHNYLKL